MKSFEHPIVLQDDLFGTRTIYTFKEYAQVLMLPDPTYIVMDDEVSDLVTEYVNNGGDVYNAFRALSSGYKYDDSGHEYISFANAEQTKEILQTLGKV